MNDKTQCVPVRTTIRAGQPTDHPVTPLDRVMFILLDALQKPTDWMYARLIKRA